MQEFPKVSVIVYNYNYGRYLAECFDSVIDQDYPNTEIIFSDNASTDQSWEIALQYDKKFPELFFLTKNRQNFGAVANMANCIFNARGEYVLFLASDDYIKPNYISRCVGLLEEHLDAGFVMVHRSIVNSDGSEIQEAPFYDNDYKLYPPSQVGVYFMSPVNPTISQVFYRGTTLKPHAHTLNDLYFGHRFTDFLICLKMPIIYLTQALTVHRVHGESDTEKITENLIQIFGLYVMNHQFAEMVKMNDWRLENPEFVERKFDKSLKRIAEVSLKYSLNSLVKGKQSLAEKYWHLSLAIDLDIKNTDLAQKLEKAFIQKDTGLYKQLKELDAANARSASYKPDPPFEIIDTN